MKKERGRRIIASEQILPFFFRRARCKEFSAVDPGVKDTKKGEGEEEGEEEGGEERRRRRESRLNIEQVRGEEEARGGRCVRVK